jgi:hypothetical protein
MYQPLVSAAAGGWRKLFIGALPSVTRERTLTWIVPVRSEMRLSFAAESALRSVNFV